jgi:thiol-disulfide isomerase/thioredoxin
MKNKLVFLWALLALCLAEDAWTSKANVLVTANFSSAFPYDGFTYVYFYETNCEHCKSYSGILDEVITLLKDSKQPMRFYRIDGPGNPDIISKFKQVEDSPALAYFKPGSTEITSMYKEQWKLENIKNWINNNIEHDKSQKAAEVKFDPKLCEGYEKANKMCDGYDKLGKEMTEVKAKLEEMKAKIIELTKLTSKSQEPIMVKEEGSWIGGLLIFLGGAFVGFIVCYIIFIRVNKKVRTTI